jgi:hypothetical protein
MTEDRATGVAESAARPGQFQKHAYTIPPPGAKDFFTKRMVCVDNF